MNESPIDPSDEAVPEPLANADRDAPSDDQTAQRRAAPDRLAEAFEEAAAEEAVADAAIEEALAETVAEAIEDAAAVEAASDAAIEESFEERVSDAVDAGLEGEALEDTVAEAAANADVQESIADAAIVGALEETVAEAVEDATAVEAMSDAAILGDLADTVESIAADVEQAEDALGGAPASDAEPAEAPEPAAEAEPAARAKNGAASRATEESVDTEGGRDPFRGPGDWYVVHTYAGYENKVKTNLESRIHTMQMEDKIFDVHIPMEDVMEIKGGKKQVVQRKVFPGYLLVKMVYDNDSWYVVRNTPGVTGFVAAGTGSKPTPLSRREVEKILSVKKEEVKPQFRLGFEENDVVRIISGPFADFNGTISEINLDQSKLKVLVNIFDRETPVELSFDQVAKV
ncbi:MAG TPA: transcription termination/antitermination protein NusG [Actinomycetota bacterium]|nr:transcription termination/antitermination protein NusG [Actinomycetota bacterium]